MKSILKFGLVMTFVLLGAITFNACEDDDDLGKAPRLFRPIAEGESGGQWINIEWDVMDYAKYYQVELSVDSFKTIDTTIVTSTSPLLIESGIEWDTQYQIRIKVVGENLESAYYVLEDVKVPDYPTLLQDVTSDDIIDVAAIVRWTNDETTPFTSLEFITGETVTSIPLTEDDLASGYKEVYGLEPDTAYIVKIYSEDVYRGKKRFNTRASQEFENPVDLRELSDEVSQDYLTQSFLDGLVENSTIVLKGGQSYVLTSTLKLSMNVKFVTGYSFYGKAKIVMGDASTSGGFSLADAASFGKVEFDGIDFITGNDKTSANFGGRYIFNISPSSLASVNEIISFENCNIRYLRGVVRAQGNVALEHVKINNCILDSIGGYGVINCDNANSVIRNMTLTNSTVTHAEKILVNSKSATSGSIIVDNCTFNWTPTGSGNYYLDFGSMTIAGDVLFTDCILAAVYTTSTAQTCNGFRSATNAITASGNYRTSDFTWTLKADGVSYNGTPIEATVYSKSYTELWNNPTLIDYYFKDSKFEGKGIAGDPRWW
ncbi:MAG: DUF5123 domain-containing protein [Breznakibacter sp.]